ncbi:hypothetical protein Pyn_36079 [Prunus yedoensis var. nudiflora]|uniref:Uncharacterized protein n=1 Tax=Prunus yedoensis var. nudiflora TaxID=2094558 RepID=A0A314U7D2_PRUYE|nr:hypothetical protein Pyn_36079 [Prunus yedoensis var. nudiflora]
MSQCSLLLIRNRLALILPFTYWKPKRAFTSINWEALPKQNQLILVAASLSTTMRVHISLAAASIPAVITVILKPSTSILWVLQPSQQPSTNISWLLKHPSNHQTTFHPPFGCCNHSSGHLSHSLAITTMSPTTSHP